MKKWLVALIIVLVSATLCLGLIGCSGAESGTYYEVKGSSLDESSWIELSGGKWKDDDGESGKYELDGDKITILQDGEELMTGTLKDGTLTLEMWGIPAGTYRTKDAQENLSNKSASGSGNGVATDNGSSQSGIISEQKDEKAMVKSAEGGSVNGMTISFEVGENIDYIDLSGKLTVSEDSSWQLYEDITGQRLVPTKYAANLVGGYNTFYVVVNSSDGTINRTYTLNIWKNYYVTVSYYVLDELFGSDQVLTHTYLKDYYARPFVMGYTFNGWGCEGRYVNDRGLRFDASMTPNTYIVTLNANEGLLPSGASDTKKLTYASSFSLPVPSRTGYSFLGWYVGGTKITDGYGSSTYPCNIVENCTLTAQWSINNYKVTAVANDSDAGRVDGGGTYAYNRVIVLEASTHAGYTWLGWYKGEEKVSKGNSLTYTFNMPAENVTYTAKWISCPVTLEKSIAEAGIVSGVEGATAIGESTTITAETNAGYTWLGWYDGDEKVSKGNSLTYTFNMPAENVTYTAKWISCPVTLEKSIAEAGIVSGVEGATAIGESTTITAETNAGYTWLGWYDGDEKVSEGNSLTYTFAMPEEDATYTARWTYYTLTTNTNLSGAGTYTSISSQKTTAGQSVTLTASTKSGYTWLGWYKGEEKVSEGNSLTYTFAMPEEDVTYTAKWGIAPEMESYVFTSTASSCTITGVKDKTISSASIPDYVSSIGSYAFSACSSLTSIYYMGDVAGWCGISGLGNLMSSSRTLYINGTKVEDDLVIPEGVTSIGSSAFYGCSSLTSVTIPNSVTSIGFAAFSGCASLEKMTIPFVGRSKSATSASSSTLFGYIFGTSSYTGGTSVKQYYNSNDYSTYYIPSSLRSVTVTGGNILYGAFECCSMLTSVTIPEGVTSIGSSAFYGCSSLTSVTIPNSVTSIGDYAFRGCSTLTSITIPSSVTSIGSSAFYQCYKLVEVYNQSSLNIRKGSSDYGYLGYYAKNVYKTAGGSKLSTNDDGYILYTDGSTVSLIGYVGSDTALTLPAGITEIYHDTFYERRDLTSVIIPDSVTSIGSSAFYGCSSLTSVTIGSGVTSIGSYAFSICSSLTSVTIGSGVTSIGEYAFNYCRGLTSITIPSGVTSIGYGAFSDCSDLDSITFLGTKNQWGAISKEGYYNTSTSRFYISCIDGYVWRS